MTPADAIMAARAADDNFTAAIKSAGFKSRWDWISLSGPAELDAAYSAKVAADNAMHQAFEQSRKSA